MRRLLTSFLLMPALASAAPAQPPPGPTRYSPSFARVSETAEMLWELCPKPDYPRASVRNEEQGVVTLSFTVAPSGRLLAAKVVRSSGFPGLDNAAYGALARCRFKPARLEGLQVQATVNVQYVWSLD